MMEIENFLFGDYVQVLSSSGSPDDHNATFLQNDLLEVSFFLFFYLKVSCNSSSLVYKPDMGSFKFCICKFVIFSRQGEVVSLVPQRKLNELIFPIPSYIFYWKSAKTENTNTGSIQAQLEVDRIYAYEGKSGLETVDYPSLSM